MAVSGSGKAVYVERAVGAGASFGGEDGHKTRAISRERVGIFGEE